MNKNNCAAGILFLLMVTLFFTTSYGNADDVNLPADPGSKIGDLFQGTEGAIVIYDLNGKRYVRYNKARCDLRLSPKSTFKIPNSLIALETGAVKDTETIIPWDSKRDPKEKWWAKYKLKWDRDHTLRSALKHSVVWFYRELARRIGKADMKKWMTKLAYGNIDLSGHEDYFWLDDSLKISANEQVEFLKKFYAGQLGFSDSVTAKVKEILVREKGENYTLSAKTGGGGIKTGGAVGW
ncbi:MAG: class D beta-lactamase, partial [bacterium]|nr:class D beta-lactamase [bacterium]